jgi:hypothetical protein
MVIDGATAIDSDVDVAMSISNVKQLICDGAQWPSPSGVGGKVLPYPHDAPERTAGQVVGIAQGSVFR